MSSSTSVAGWSRTFQTSGGTSVVALTGVTLDNSNRGIASITFTDNVNVDSGHQVNAYCATDANASTTWTSEAVPGTWTTLTGDAYWGDTLLTHTVSDASPSAARSGFLTNLCASGETVRAIRVWAFDAGTSSFHYSVYQRLLPATPSTCTDGFQSARASYVAGVLAVRFSWTTALPASNWRIQAPGDGYTVTGTANTTTVPRVKITGTNDYGVNYTATLSVTPGASTLRLSRGDDFGCYTVVPIQGTALDDSVSVAGKDPETGEDCSYWDLFCNLKAVASWVFVPSQESQDALGDTLGSISDKAPFSMVSTFSSYGELISGCSVSRTGSTGDGCELVHMVVSMPGVDVAGYTNPGESWVLASEADPSDEPGFMQALVNYRGTLNALVWVGFIGGIAWAVFRWASPFGALAAWSSRPAKSDD